ncbi:MAG: acetate--CoA ligase family protein [Acidimicrobiia bacterium]
MLPASPTSVAVVGASERNFFTRCVVDNLRIYGFAGTVTAVNPSGATGLDVPVVASVADLPTVPDVAVVGVRADRCPGVARELVGRGVRTVLVVSDGFSEAGTDEGRALERELAEVCRTAGATLIGPNGVGAADFHTGLVSIGAVVSDRVRPGPVSVVSQSGGLMLAILDALVADAVGADLAVSVGNGATADVLDALVAAARRPETRVVCAYVEGFPPDPVRLDATLSAVRAEGVRLVVLKSGRSDVARRLALSHTATITGSAELSAALFARHGVVQVDDVESMARAARLAVDLGEVGDRGLAVITSSGGGAALMAELSELHGVALADFAAGTTGWLGEIVASSGHIGNPVDLSGQTGSDPERTRSAVEAILADPGVGAMLLPFSVAFPDDEPHRGRHRQHLEVLAGAAVAASKPFVVASIAPQALTPWVEELAARFPGTVVVSGLKSTMEALGHLVPRRPPDPDGEPDGSGPATAGPEGEAGRVLSEAEGRALLEPLGVPLVAAWACADEAALAAAWPSVRPPVVVKAILPGVGHKAAVGGVELGVADLATARAACARIRGRVAAAGRDLAGFLVQEQVAGTELIVGFGRDPIVGPSVTLGLGGVLAEATDLHAAALLPLRGRADLADLVARAGLVPLFARFGPAVRDRIFALVERVAGGFVGGDLTGLASVEVNPLFVTADGRVLVADVLAVETDDEGSADG